MKIILLKELENVGKRGDIKEVKDGFARNYLIPNGFALIANSSTLKAFKALEEHEKHKKEKEKNRALKLKEKIEKFKLRIKAKSGEEGKLFGGISSIDILNGLKEHGILVEKGMINLDDAIRSLGKYEVEIKLHPEVKAILKVEVIPEGE